ncbi:hypothetical protein J40TS1_45520 [Paenibacillus montaniterrae]|uniref:DUF58 domain-containing protein n=1 Tax=Paenibacillus montaniterrae TaxID=429341 RepID=A0A919YSZ3_9BACL|nr:DUF58 domain-containing protein [Paenibacillus montaniterrae]GIP18910.1 hypothetical protein J40TS1_45520 [Paenibacillus montaniterrae]
MSKRSIKRSSSRRQAARTPQPPQTDAVLFSQQPAGEQQSPGEQQQVEQPKANKHEAMTFSQQPVDEQQGKLSNSDNSQETADRLEMADQPASTLHSARTAPVGKVVELEPSYRTRYVAWAGIVVLWLASLAAVVLRGDAPEWLLLTTLTLVFISSGLFPLLAAYRLRYERSLSAATIEQGELYIAIKLQRSLPLPSVWYSIYDQLHNTSTMRGQRITLKAGFMPLFHKSMSLTYRIQNIERGSYEAKPAMIRVGDWLGLTCITVQRELAASFIVLPQFQEPEEDSYVARNTSSIWMKHMTNAGKQDQTLQHRSKLRQKRDAEFGSSSLQEEGNGLATRPYAAGDSYRRIDSRAAARGMGLHTRLAQQDDTAPKLCMLLDQYDLPYQDAQQDQLFDSMVNWCLADTIKAGEEQNVSVLSDNWSFEYGGQRHAAELKYLLALTRPDVTTHLKERVQFLAPLLPDGGHVVVYSGAWKDSEGWLALAEAAWLKGSSLELQFVTTNRVMTYAMREQQKVLEAAGIQLVWRYSYVKPASIIEVEKGSERYASGT